MRAGVGTLHYNRGTVRLPPLRPPDWRCATSEKIKQERDVPLGRVHILAQAGTAVPLCARSRAVYQYSGGVGRGVGDRG